jgi:hypothetical protein
MEMSLNRKVSHIHPHLSLFFRVVLVAVGEWPTFGSQQQGRVAGCVFFNIH